jgi:hypothetical protein
MFKKPFLMTALTCALMLTSGFALAADKDRDRIRLDDPEQAMDQTRDSDRDQDRDNIKISEQDPIYGSQLMTVQERQDYRDLMRVAKTDVAREQIRLEHHQQMQQRAQQRGSKLPDEPPARGSGMNQGMGAGGGMGGGMGSGGTGGGKP